ncbi:MAG: 2'-5' RNA ligase family protein [Ferruginibacter sp.]
MLFTLPGYDVHEYLVVLQPHEEVQTKITQVKKIFAEEFLNEHALYSRPHIALVRFKQLAMQEEKIISRLKNIAMGLAPVKIELSDYGSFPAHTIYINVKTKLPVQYIVKKIRTDAQRLMKLDADNKPHFLIDPYIPIARKLVPWQYEKAWEKYAHKNFTGRFIADGILVLRRKEGEKNYQVLRRLTFDNLPVNTTQASLFS